MGKLWITFLLSVTAFAAEMPPLQAVVTATTVEVANATGDVIFMTAMLANEGGHLHETTGALRVPDEDGDGVVRYSPPRGIPLRAIWVAVDLQSGRSVIAGPAGYDIAIVPFPATLLKREAEGILGVFDSERVSAQMLVVRPKEGAWRLLAIEGNGVDGDREQNGKLSLANSDADPVGASGPPPKHLKNGDVIAVIDPGRMEIFVTEIGK